MTIVGIDIEQFVRDPYGSGIQRVLQYLAREWPSESVQAEFIVPSRDGFALLAPEQAADLLTLPFLPREPGTDLRQLVAEALEALDAVRVRPGDLLALYDAWLLPEVSYLPSVLERLEVFSRCVPVAMIGYDILPMSEPGNYRFVPGSAAWVSEYFRLLATADTVICISDYARDSILGRLRRDVGKPITVAHPGGDHLPARSGNPPERPLFTRLGTLEARKRPVEILRAFLEAVQEHAVDADLLFIGGPSASDESINAAVRDAAERSGHVEWVVGASDEEVHDLVNGSSAFLSIGTEGYGIPVLEAIRLGTPVLYDGIQPAGDVMAGRGARRVPAMGHDDLVRLFVEYARPGELTALAAEARSATVPTWRDFSRAVAGACCV